MSWTTPVDAAVGQLAGENSGMFSLNTYVRDNIAWLEANKFEIPITGAIPLELDVLGNIPATTAYQLLLCVKVLSGDTGRVDIEVGPTGQARTVIASVGTTAEVSNDEQYTIEFIAPPDYDIKLTSTGTITIQTDFHSAVVAWNL